MCNIRRLLPLAATLALLWCAATTSAFAQVYTTTVTSAGTGVTDGTFGTNKRSGLGYSLSDLAPGSNLYNYVAVSFTASSNATYYFGQTQAPVDTVMVLYNGAFNPANAQTNAIVTNDDADPVADHQAVGADITGIMCGSPDYCPQVSYALTAGQTITLVVTTYLAGAGLGYPITFYSSGGGGGFSGGSGGGGNTDPGPVDETGVSS